MKFPDVVNPGRLLNFGVPLQGSGLFQHNDTASWLQTADRGLHGRHRSRRNN